MKFIFLPAHTTIPPLAISPFHWAPRDEKVPPSIIRWLPEITATALPVTPILILRIRMIHIVKNHAPKIILILRIPLILLMKSKDVAPQWKSSAAHGSLRAASGQTQNAGPFGHEPEPIHI